ncbi:MAG TPA: cupin-like domain-containing protein [Sphingomicrobium sp.]
MSHATRVAEFTAVDRSRFNGEIEAGHEPAVLRGLVSDWPSVAAGRESSAGLVEYLSSRDNRAQIRAFVGQPSMRGRYFYSPGVDGFNFAMTETSLSELLKALLDPARNQSSIYMGSTGTSHMLPTFASENPLPLLDPAQAEPRIWIGNDSRVAPHYDEADNIACVIGGRRRFILFPTEQVQNLYVGPLDRTIAGQPISMVDLDAPDYERFPKFREAERHALVADLEPGDAIYIPALWWHAVQASGDVNALVNYWWTDHAMDAGSPMHALGHGLLTISHLPEHKRQAWRVLFDHYVFKQNGEPAEHIPEHARGIIGRSTPALRQMIKQFLMRALSSL